MKIFYLSIIVFIILLILISIYYFKNRENFSPAAVAAAAAAAAAFEQTANNLVLPNNFTSEILNGIREYDKNITITFPLSPNMEWIYTNIFMIYNLNPNLKQSSIFNNKNIKTIGIYYIPNNTTYIYRVIIQKSNIFGNAPGNPYGRPVSNLGYSFCLLPIDPQNTLDKIKINFGNDFGSKIILYSSENVTNTELNNDYNNQLNVLLPYKNNAFSFMFTNGIIYGSKGPSLNSLLNNLTYSSIPWTKDINSFNVINGIQLWTVPFDDTYTIIAAGAAGGNNAYPGNKPGGYGVIISTTIALNKGQIIKILIGNKGISGIPDYYNNSGHMANYLSICGSGGGGTFVTKNDNTPILVAGGGGGAGLNFWNESGYTDNNNQINGQITVNGGQSIGGIGGLSGNGGTQGQSMWNLGNGAGGGGGIKGNSLPNGVGNVTQNPTPDAIQRYNNTYDQFALSFINGGIGANIGGGFGGGGFGNGGGGGGGGYSGGGGGVGSTNNNNNSGHGAGGGSYDINEINKNAIQYKNSINNQSNGYNTKDGFVIIISNKLNNAIASASWNYNNQLVTNAAKQATASASWNYNNQLVTNAAQQAAASASWNYNNQLSTNAAKQAAASASWNYNNQLTAQANLVNAANAVASASWMYNQMRKSIMAPPIAPPAIPVTIQIPPPSPPPPPPPPSPPPPPPPPAKSSASKVNCSGIWQTLCKPTINPNMQLIINTFNIQTQAQNGGDPCEVTDGYSQTTYGEC